MEGFLHLGICTSLFPSPHSILSSVLAQTGHQNYGERIEYGYNLLLSPSLLRGNGFTLYIFVSCTCLIRCQLAVARQEV